jgi:hypothetical protein
MKLEAVNSHMNTAGIEGGFPSKDVSWLNKDYLKGGTDIRKFTLSLLVVIQNSNFYTSTYQWLIFLQ